MYHFSLYTRILEGLQQKLGGGGLQALSPIASAATDCHTGPSVHRVSTQPDRASATRVKTFWRWQRWSRQIGGRAVNSGWTTMQNLVTIIGSSVSVTPLASKLLATGTRRYCKTRIVRVPFISRPWQPRENNGSLIYILSAIS